MSSKENSNRAASHDFQTALGLLEERLRSLEDSEAIINGLLQGAAEFYGAARASVVEADWNLKIGLLTYEWCAEGIEHQKDMLQYLAVESFPRWCEFLSLNRPVVIPDMEAIKDTYPDEYQFFQNYGVKSILAAPFSKRINQGYIAVDDPTRFQDDPTFLFIISYAVVVELNEIKLSQSIAAAQRASKYSDRDVYVNCLGDLEIRNAKGTLTEDDISSDLCLNLFALIITNAKCPLKANRLAEELWPEDVIDNPYRTVSNIAYRLRRILSIIGLEDLIVGRHGAFVINPKYTVYTDFDRFDETCNRLKAETNPKAQHDLYRSAVALYRGDLFSKISYQHWLMPTASYYRNNYLRTYPTLTTIDTFYVSEDGYLITPQKLSAGSYQLVEVQAPYGYVLNSTPIDFTVTSSENEDLEGLCVITVTAYDMAQKGKISITKSGEVFASVNVTGEEGVVDKEGIWGIINPIYSAVYELRNLAGASYQVIADENIYTGDGTLRAEAGTVVAEITTDENGIAETGELYLGKYRVVETNAPEGFALNQEAQLVELTYAGQEVSVTSASTGFVNNRQKLQLSAEKTMEQNETYGIGMNGEITAVSFGLYAKNDITAADGSVIPADGLMEIAFADEAGSISFKSDLPFGSYYVKELTTDPHYSLNETIYEVEFSYCGQETEVQTVDLSGGSIENIIKYGRIEGYKINDVVADGEEYGLAGAVFGIFAEGTMELDEAHAITTVISGEDGYFTFENVPYGDYLVVELKAPESYVLSDARHFVSITYAGQVIGLKVINYPIIGSVELTKVDKDYPENHLAGAEFTVYKDVNRDGELDNADSLIGTMKEYENGVYRMDGLRSGLYIVKETKAPEGFLLDENSYAFSITEDGQIAVIENKVGVGFADQVIMGQFTISKTDKATGAKLVGAGFRVCDKDGKTVAEGKTGKDGTVSFALRYGEYTVFEYEAPEGFVLDDTPYSFTINENGQKLSVDMSNTKITGKLMISKVDAKTEKLLPDAGFRIYASDGKTVVKEGRTDKKGVCEFTLEFGKYYYQEFDAPDGYKIDDRRKYSLGNCNMAQ